MEGLPDTLPGFFGAVAPGARFPHLFTMSGPPAPRDPTPPALRRRELDRIIRRAAELQFHESEGGDEADELTEAEILRIGEEVGLEPGHLRRALGEVRAEQLTPALREERGLLAGAVGPARVQAARAIPGRVADLSPRLHEWLRRNESLTPLRERLGSSVWEPNQGFTAQLQRGFNLTGRNYELARGKSLEVSVVELEEGWVLVTLVADLSNVRTEHGLGWGLGIGLGSLGAGVGVALAVSFPPAAIVGTALAAGVGGGAAGTTLARQTFAPARARMAIALEGLLDRCERGDFGPGKRKDFGILGNLQRLGELGDLRDLGR
jgi:hypothetical protein